MTNSGKVFDIMVKPEQRIMEIIHVLMENGQIDIKDEETIYARSWRKGNLINTRLTFKKENVYTGDIIYIEVEQNG